MQLACGNSAQAGACRNYAHGGTLFRKALRPIVRRVGPAFSGKAEDQSQDSALQVTSVTSETDTAKPLYAAVGGLAGLGAVETLYLTLGKFLDVQVACPSEGCETVLNSTYASLFGLPLSLYGCITYLGVATLAAVCHQRQQSGESVPAALSSALLGGSAVLSTTSAILLYILFTKLNGQQCVWCFTSAALSFTALSCLLITMPRRQLQEALLPGLSFTLAAVLLLPLGLGVYDSQAEFELAYKDVEVTTKSTDQALALVTRLRQAGAKMYGAFWCVHCLEQKEKFGEEAMKSFPYVECYPDGWKRGIKIADVCDAAGVRSFPTWIIGNEVLEGGQPIATLEAKLDALDAAKAQTTSGGAVALAATP